MDQLTREFKQRLQERTTAWETHDVVAPPVAEVLALATGLLPPAAPSALGEQVGPFYDTGAVAALLGGVSKQAVDSRRRKHTILAVKTADGRWAYPTFQFTGTSVDPRLVPVIQVFQDAPAWSTALWFVTPNPDLDGMTPLAWAGSRRPTDGLVASARHTAREWQ